jgi:hypothetical protein
MRCSFVAPAAELPGKARAVDALAAFVERDQRLLLRQQRRDRRSFFGNPRGGVARAAFRDLMDVEAAKPELAADILEALAVTLGELPFRALFQTADADHDKAHQRRLAALQPIRIGYDTP